MMSNTGTRSFISVLFLRRRIVLVVYFRDRREYRYRIEKPYSDTDTWYQYQYRYRLGAFLSPGISPGIDWGLFLVSVSVPVSIKGFPEFFGGINSKFD